MKAFFTFLVIIVFSLNLMSQSVNFQAQGYYYKAKELYEQKSYSAALPYIEKAKTTLGGTNELLQYLNIMCLVATHKWSEANKELQTYFDLVEGRLKPIYFSKTVERLTDDETKALSKAMVDIQEKAAYEQSPQAKREKCLQEIASILNELVYKDVSKTWEFSQKRNANTCSLSESFYSSGSYTYQYRTKCKEIDPRPSCNDYQFEEKAYAFNIDNISSVVYMSSGSFSYLGYGSETPGINEPGLKLIFKTTRVCKYTEIFYFHCGGFMDGEHKKNKDLSYSSVILRLKSSNQDKIKKINELLKTL